MKTSKPTKDIIGQIANELTCETGNPASLARRFAAVVSKFETNHPDTKIRKTDQTCLKEGFGFANTVVAKIGKEFTQEQARTIFVAVYCEVEKSVTVSKKEIPVTKEMEDVVRSTAAINPRIIALWKMGVGITQIAKMLGIVSPQYSSPYQRVKGPIRKAGLL